MSVDALRDNVELIDRYFLPMNVEHDIRLPTVGRVVAAEVVELPGGEYALDGVEETFEAGDDLDRVYRGDKVMISGISARDRAVIEYDRMLSGAGGDALLARLLEVTELESHELVKWSMDPIGVLALGAGGIALASTAKGFFQKLGEDAYASLKSVLASEFRRPKLRDRVLTEFHYVLATDGCEIEVHIVVHGPTETELEYLHDRALCDIESQLCSQDAVTHKVQKLVFRLKGRSLELLYAVRSDCAPLHFPDGKPRIYMPREVTKYTGRH